MEEFIDESFFDDDDDAPNKETNNIGLDLFSLLQIGSVAKYIEPVSGFTTLEGLSEIFAGDPLLQAVPVEEYDAVIGIIDRKTVEKQTSTTLKRFMGKDALSYVKRTTHILQARDYLEKNLKKITEISRKEEILFFPVFHHNSFFGIISLDDFIERIAELREQDMLKAREIQQNLLPKPRNLDNMPFKLITWNKMLSQVGGDFYVAQELSPKFYIIGCFDVSGKNYSAALLTVAIGAVFAAMKSILAPSDTPEKITAMLDTWLENIMPVGNFVTAALCFINTEKKSVVLQNCGHTPVYIFVPNADKTRQIQIATIQPTLPPLGMGAVKKSLDSGEKTTSIFPYSSGMHINLYTDGLTDMQSDGGARFEDQATKKFFIEFFKLDETELQDFAEKTINDWLRNSVQGDDITIMDIRF